MLLRITCRFPNLDYLAIALRLGQLCYAWVPGVLGRCELRSRHTPSESMASLHGIKMEALEQSVSVMVRMVSYSPDGGNFVMKSMAIVSNGRAFSVGVIGNSGG